MKMPFEKSFSSKASAMFAMMLSLAGVALLLIGTPQEMIYPPNEDGWGAGFGGFVAFYVLAICSMIFYLVDAVLCIVRACRRYRIAFNILLAIWIVFCIPMVIFGASLGAGSICFTVYYIALFVLETASLVLLMRDRRRMLGRLEKAREERPL